MSLITNKSDASSSLKTLFNRIDPIISEILDKFQDNKEISINECVELFNTNGIDLIALIMIANEIRKRNVGDIVTYVVNRNINFTNICIKRCSFCAFSRNFGDKEGYLLPIKEVVRMAKEAKEMGATEVCIQAGLYPNMSGDVYINICKAIKKEIPDIHIHAFSPEEIMYGALKSNTTIKDYLMMLKESGLGSIPGTAAEIFDDKIKKIIAPKRITTKDWLKVIKTAHGLGIPTTATIMYGHIESSLDKAKHLAKIREIQKETHGITEFVPLSFIHHEAPIFKEKLVKNIRPGATGTEVVKMYAVSRLMLNNVIDNIQTSWVKEGKKFAQYCLNVGANDFGGTLFDESISRSAGATHGQFISPDEIRNLILDIGRIPAERSTVYNILKIYDS